MIYIKEVQDYIDYVENNPKVTDKEIKLLIENIVKPLLQSDDVIFNDKQYYQCISFCEKWFYKLFPYQKFLYAFFFFYEKNDLSVCFFQEIFLMIGRGNGKDGAIMPLACYFLTPGYGVKNYHIDIVANSEDQAKNSFDVVYNMLEDNKNKMKKWFYWTKEVIINRVTKSRLRYNTSGAKTKDGKQIGMIIFNEVHAYQDESQLNVFSSALGKIYNARIVTITTNGFVREGPLDEKIDLSNSVLRGELNYTKIAPIIYKIDKKELVDIPMQKYMETMNKDDIDYSYWLQANPSLQYMNTLKNQIMQDYLKMLKTPSYVSEFYAKRMNLPEQDSENVTVEWENIEKASYSDVKRKISRDNSIVEGGNVVIGIDFADLNDFASAGMLFVRENGEVVWNCHTWICSNGRDFKNIKFPAEKMCGKIGYTDYEIVRTNTISAELIVNWVLEQMEHYNVVKIVMDNYRAGLIRGVFETAGISIEDKEHKDGLVRTIRYPASIAAIVAPKIEILFIKKEKTIVDSFISWIGGKKLLRKRICEEFPKEYDMYVEVFGGAGWILFYEERKGKVEIYNDYNSELINLFRCVKFHAEELKKELQYFLNSRELFKDYFAQYHIRGLTDIQRAARFFVIIKISYASKLTSFSCAKKNINNMIAILENVQKRLNSVIIENEDFEKIIKMRDEKNTFFYLDPPYFGTEKYYKNVEFTQDDHQRLYNILKNISGKFLVSYNDCEYIRKLYKDYNIEEVKRFSNITTTLDEQKKYNELIIKNY